MTVHECNRRTDRIRQYRAMHYSGSLCKRYDKN